ncbi:MAG: type II toxin-antitoxin system RelE/ParE family toxin [Candidatus Gottesmanbacteria bacterium]
MSFHLVFTKNAFNDIQKLDRVAQKRLAVKLQHFQEKPIFYAKKLTSPILGQYRWRVGNYRIIFDLHGKDIIILKVGHRKEIYR